MAKGAVAAREGERVVIGLANLVIHRVGEEETTRHQRSRTDKGNQRVTPLNRELRRGKSARRMAVWHSFGVGQAPFRDVGLLG